MTRKLWTDGSASPNPGPGGYAVIENSRPVALGREAASTNIKMEAAALLAALSLAGSEPVEIITDSQFWVNTLTQWAPAWKRNGWKKKSGPIKNLPIVKALLAAYEASHATLTFTYGHVGTPENELADHWANLARANDPADSGLPIPIFDPENPTKIA